MTLKKKGAVFLQLLNFNYLFCFLCINVTIPTITVINKAIPAACKYTAS